ncbi:CPBP family intramembrane metalloprotease [Pseudooceanicola sp. CBS1P-1]|uniref:CPBP family intramembrane metalloprotease n=1 Tax=Pseudooceanicola albus TaxID=2692189 RepID=A0A6L7G6U9_9RHOB|nr:MULTISPECIES: type II CAAX endopeptidase family protein [Pseudooceanicola]MBT9384109.1 CPBP family intramembrane metalloprotease [Pseudooceanicola endophyticus]MXN19791.1 CPBP family intramembrane metalloprotease [Pseudooceanicola albus]
MEHPDPADIPPAAPRWSDDPPALWRTGMGIGIFLLLYLTISGIWFLGAAALFPPQPGVVSARLTLIYLGSFSAGLLALAGMVNMVHGRALHSLLGPWPLALRQGLRVGLAGLALQTLLWILPMPEELAPVRHLATPPWLLLLPLAVPAVAVQIATEELLFRGYLQARLAQRFRSPWIWMAAPSILFGLLHFQASEGANGPWFVASATLFGLVAADLTARSGTLGPALALHLVNNLLAILLVSFGDQLGGLALYHLPVASADPALRPLMPLDLATTAVTWLAARLALRR